MLSVEVGLENGWFSSRELFATIPETTLEQDSEKHYKALIA